MPAYPLLTIQYGTIVFHVSVVSSFVCSATNTLLFSASDSSPEKHRFPFLLLGKNLKNPDATELCEQFIFFMESHPRVCLTSAVFRLLFFSQTDTEHRQMTSASIFDRRISHVKHKRRTTSKTRTFGRRILEQEEAISISSNHVFHFTHNNCQLEVSTLCPPMSPRSHILVQNAWRYD